MVTNTYYSQFDYTNWKLYTLPVNTSVKIITCKLDPTERREMHAESCVFTSSSAKPGNTQSPSLTCKT